MRYLAAFLLLIFSTACSGQASPDTTLPKHIAQPNSWIVVIGAVNMMGNSFTVWNITIKLI